MQELIKRLRSFAEYEADLDDESKFERIEWESADLIESQAAEIEKYKALCDQLRDALEEAMYSNSTSRAIDKSVAANTAWRAMK